MAPPLAIDASFVGFSSRASVAPGYAGPVAILEEKAHSSDACQRFLRLFVIISAPFTVFSSVHQRFAEGSRLLGGCRIGICGSCLIDRVLGSSLFFVDLGRGKSDEQETERPEMNRMLLVSTRRRLRKRLNQHRLFIRKRITSAWRLIKKLRISSPLKLGKPRRPQTSRRELPAPGNLFEEVEPPKGDWCLIPGLPHDVALQCLARVPRMKHWLLRSVCKSWRWILETSEFQGQRKDLGCTEDWLYLHVGTSPHLDERRDGLKRSRWQLVGGFSLWHALDPYRYHWHALPPIPYDLSVTGGQVVLGATSVVMHGNLYVIGGAPFGKAAIRDVWVYNPLRNKWRRAAAMQTPRFACLASTIKGKLYVIGGSGICHLTGYSLPCLEVYNPKTNSWSYAASARGIVTAHPCSPLKYVAVVDDKLCVIGPQNVSGGTNSGMYDPEQDCWLQIRPGLRAGWGRASTVMDGSLYTIDFGCYQQYVEDKDCWLPVGGRNAESLLEWDPRLVSAMAGTNGKLYMVGTMGPALIVVIVPVQGSRVNQKVCWHTMKLPDGVDFLGDLGHCSCQVITY